MPNKCSEVHLDQLIKQILFLILQFVCHSIFGVLAWLPASLFEGSPLALWTPQTSRRCHQAARCPRWARSSCPTPAGSRTRPGMSFMRRCWRQGRGNLRPPAAFPQARPSHRPGATQVQHPTCSPSPARVPSMPPTPPSLRERLHQLVLQHQRPRAPAPGRGYTPPPPYSNLQNSARPGLNRENSVHRPMQTRPTRSRRRALVPGSPAGAATLRSSRTPSSPPPLEDSRKEGAESASDQSS